MTDAVLLPYQQAWLADHSQVKIIEKSRRVGLSWAEAADSALTAAAANDNGGMDVWYVGYNQAMAQEFVRDVAFWAKHFNQAAELIGEQVLRDEDKDIITYSIKFSSGNRVTALSSRPSNLRGKQGVVVIDEAAHHDDLPSLIKAAMALLIWGGKVRIISTHFGVDNAFNSLIEDARAGKLPYSVHRVTFDDAVTQGLCKRVMAATGKVWSALAEAEWVAGIRAIYSRNAAEELDCIPSQSGGAYLSRALIESRMSADTPVLRFEAKDGFELQADYTREAHVLGWLEFTLKPILDTLPKLHRSTLGMDFGRSGDLSVIVPLIENQGLVRTTPFTLELRNVPFEQQRQILFYLADKLPRFAYAALDKTGNGAYLAEVTTQRYGAASVSEVSMSQTWYLENMPRMKAWLEDGTLDQLPRDADVLDDLRLIQVIKGIPKIPDARTTGADSGKRHGDTAVALALACFASAQGGQVFEYIDVPRRATENLNHRDFRDMGDTLSGRKDW